MISAGHRLEYCSFTVPLDEVSGYLQALQQRKCLSGHRAGNHIASNDDLVNAFAPNLSQHHLQCWQISMNVVECGDAHADPPAADYTPLMCGDAEELPPLAFEPVLAIALDSCNAGAQDGVLAPKGDVCMRGRRKVVGAVLGVVFAVAFAPRASAQEFTGLMGTWKLNLAKSTFSPGPAPRSMTITYTSDGKSLTIAVDVVTAEGSSQHRKVTAGYDGKDYPVTGDPAADMIRLRRISATEGESIFTRGGKVVKVNKRTVSADGRTLTITTEGTTADGKPQKEVAVYDRQP